MEKENLSPTKLAEVLKIQPSNISHLLGGRNKPSFELLEKILVAFPHISGDWLINGSGEYSKGLKTPHIKPIIKEQSLFEPATTVTPVNIKQESFSNDKSSEPIANVQHAHTSTNNLHTALIKASRIIVFYDDNTFDEFTPRNR